MEWSPGAWLDFLVKLSPAVTLIFGLAAAQVQWRRQQRLNAELIAKNHYREMLEQLLRNGALVARGETVEGFRELRADRVAYAQYRALFAVVSFALQEIYFATDPKRNRHWAEVIRLFFEPFTLFMQCEETFTPEMSSAVDPRFSTFVRSMSPTLMHNKVLLAGR